MENDFCVAHAAACAQRFAALRDVGAIVTASADALEGSARPLDVVSAAAPTVRALLLLRGEEREGNEILWRVVTTPTPFWLFCRDGFVAAWLALLAGELGVKWTKCPCRYLGRAGLLESLTYVVEADGPGVRCWDAEARGNRAPPRDQAAGRFRSGLARRACHGLRGAQRRGRG